MTICFRYFFICFFICFFIFVFVIDDRLPAVKAYLTDDISIRWSPTTHLYLDHPGILELSYIMQFTQLKVLSFLNDEQKVVKLKPEEYVLQITPLDNSLSKTSLLLEKNTLEFKENGNYSFQITANIKNTPSSSWKLNSYNTKKIFFVHVGKKTTNWKEVSPQNLTALQQSELTERRNHKYNGWFSLVSLNDALYFSNANEHSQLRSRSADTDGSYSYKKDETIESWHPSPPEFFIRPFLLTHNKKIFLIAGEGVNFWSYDPKKMLWEKETSLPTMNKNSSLKALFSYQGKIHIMIDMNQFYRLYRYNLKDKQWKQVRDYTLPVEPLLTRWIYWKGRLLIHSVKERLLLSLDLEEGRLKTFAELPEGKMRYRSSSDRLYNDDYLPLLFDDELYIYNEKRLLQYGINTVLSSCEIPASQTM